MLEGRYAKWLLPGVLFQSTLIGGGYASGREIVEFGGRFGMNGLWSILVILLGFALLCALAFEFCRVTRSYDYGTFIRGLLGPVWWLFDVLFIVMAVLVIAIVSAATGEVAQDTVGLPYLPAVAVVIAAVGALILGGGHIIEQFKSYGTVLLYGAFIFFAAVVLANNWDGLQQTLNQGGSEGSIGEALFSGGQYVSYNLVILPAVFFGLYRQTRRTETLTSGLIAGVLATFPFLLTFLGILAFFPDQEVLDAEVPWLAMLGDTGGTALVAFYAFVVVWTLVETATGLIHAIMDRINAALRAADRSTLSSAQSAGLTVVVLIAAVALARIGIIDLIAQGYGMMAYGFFALFALPLLTIGVWKITKAPAETPRVAREEVTSGV